MIPAPFDYEAPESLEQAVVLLRHKVPPGVTVHRATAGFTVNGKTYPAGSLVVKTAQAFRPHVLDMFEPQDHPDDFAYPGAPPTAPYDNAGWTLAFQMGGEFDRVLDMAHVDGARRSPVSESSTLNGCIEATTRSSAQRRSRASGSTSRCSMRWRAPPGSAGSPASA